MNSTRATQLIDSHCHLDFSQFDADREDVWARARAADVTLLVNPGADLPSSRRAILMAEQYPGVYAGVGVHPHEAASLDAPALTQLRQLARQPGVVAIGEIGLDYYRDLSPREQQRAAFVAQLQVAVELGLPIIVHQREAADDVLDTLRAWAGRLHAGGVLHAFSGDLSMAQEVVNLGFSIGIGGPVTFTNARQLPQIAGWIPADRLLLETDAPYLAPHPHRGQRNEPAYLRLIAQRLAELRNTSVEALVHQTTDNARRLFRLPA